MDTLPPENDNGNVEYKWNLAQMNKYKRFKITSQMRWRVQEESDQESALYVIGVHDDGNVQGLCRNDFVSTFINLMDCAQNLGFYTCLRALNKINDNYWAVLQVFKAHIIDEGIPVVPKHTLPDYLS